MLLVRRADARRSPRERPEPHRRARGRRLVGAGRRRGDRGLRRLRAVGLPARRPLAPPVRPGRDALGPDPPDADRRRLAGDAGRDGAAVRGDRRRSAATRSATASRALRATLRRGAAGRAASWSRCRPSRASSTSACRSSAQVLHPVLIMLAAGIGLVDRARLPRPRRRAAGRARLPGHPRPGRADGRRRLGPDACRTSRSTSSRRCSWRRSSPRAGSRSPVADRRARRRPDRDDRPGGRVGLDATSGCRSPGPTRCCPEAAIAGFVAAVAAGARRRLRRRRAGAADGSRPPARSAAAARRAALAGLLALVAVIALGPADLVGRPGQRGGQADRRALDGRPRTVQATIRDHPARRPRRVPTSRT